MDSQDCLRGRAAYYRDKFGSATPGRGPSLTPREQAIIHWRNSHPWARIPRGWVWHPAPTEGDAP